jgi:hypothetical protein
MEGRCASTELELTGAELVRVDLYRLWLFEHWHRGEVTRQESGDWLLH